MRRLRQVLGLGCGLLGLIGALCISQARAEDFDYQLEARRIATDVYVFLGRNEDFDTRNGGNIVNTGFLVGPDGVIVIDTGPSLRYGQQMRAAIARVTDKPIVLVINTHHHPDHFLGNQAFNASSIGAPASVREGIASEGNSFAENLFRLSGEWMKGTEVVVPTRELKSGPLEVAGRSLYLLSLDGHTASDLAIYDSQSGSLFAGDLLFNGRAPTTPHADLEQWQAALVRLNDFCQQKACRLVVPGHGEVRADLDAMVFTRHWLAWLQARLQSAAEAGLEMNEVLAEKLPPELARIPVAEREYRRSVEHLFPAFEARALAGRR